MKNLQKSFVALILITMSFSMTAVASVAVPSKSVYIFADETTYNGLTEKINRLASDIQSDLKIKVVVQHDNYSNPLQIRKILKQSYDSNMLAGSVLIGSIPTFKRTSDGFYTDWFYQSFDNDTACPISSDGTFPDSNLCNSFNSVSVRNVFTGRITSPDATNSLSLIGKYLDKNHAYRQGIITFPKKMLLYPSSNILIRNGVNGFKNSLIDNVNYSVNSQSRYKQQDVDLISEIDYVKQKQTYLTKLKNNRYETAIIDIHGSSDGQFPSQNYDESQITSTDIITAAPNILYVDLLSCSNGAFQSPNYIAGDFLFNGDTLLVTANSKEAAIAGFLNDAPIQPVFFQVLSFFNSSLPLGKLFTHDTSLFITQTFGDPTLRIQGNSSSSKLKISNSNIDFGSITKKLKTKTVSITNTSTQDVKISNFPNLGFTINSKTPYDFSNPIQIISSRNFMGFVLVGKNPFELITLKPKQKITLSFQFSPATYRSNSRIVTGKYMDTYPLFTSDPTQPFIDLNLQATQK